MDKNAYMIGVGNAFDLGASDAQSGIQKKDDHGAYAAGYHGYLLSATVRPATVAAASKGWDDGASGAARNDTPALAGDFTAGAVLDDLRQTYGFAYDLGKQSVAIAPPSSEGKSYAGWIAGGAAIVLGAGLLYLMRKKQSHPGVGLVAANPTKGSAVAKHGGYVWSLSYQSWDDNAEQDPESEDVPEPSEYGEIADFVDHGAYGSLKALLADLPTDYQWEGWEEGLDDLWIVSEQVPDNRLETSTIYQLRIEHDDGRPLTSKERATVDDALFGNQKR